MNSTSLQENFYDDKSIVVALDESTLAKIITEFLGNKETLTYQSVGIPFLLRNNDLEQFHYLIEQKLADQKQVFESHLTVSFNYSDKTTRTINGIKALIKVNEVRNTIINSLTMTWKVINRFHNQEQVSTQIIALTFDVINEEILLTITHTNQAWAMEIKNLLNNKIQEVMIPNTKTTRVYKKVGNLGFSSAFLIIVLLFFIFDLVKTENTENKPSKKKNDVVNVVLENYQLTNNKDELIMSLALINNLDDRTALETFKNTQFIENKILQNKIVKAYEEKSKKTYKNFFLQIFILLLNYIVSPLIIIYYAKYAYQKLRNQSFIIINNFMEKTHEKAIKMQKDLPFYGISLIAFSFIIGVIVNYFSKFFL
ncbi:MAG: hypothetical protein ACD_6C00577G0002 [uncultured bacterium]|nr:hypothetical protein [Acinetobacter lwoffii]EKE23155.1 MAG: hypothetical protein ACD_6C00577G0002 [uncultured bacterium]HCB29304.1 hypothetical protein [Acinetobacter lwoffii]